MAMVPALAHIPLGFLVGSLAEFLTEASGDWAAARFPIANCPIACRQRSLSPMDRTAGEEVWGFGGVG